MSTNGRNELVREEGARVSQRVAKTSAAAAESDSRESTSGPPETRSLRLTGRQSAASAVASASPAELLRRTGGDMTRASALLRAKAPRVPATRPATSSASEARIASPGEALSPGQHWLSDSGNAMFAYQEDGNLVLYVRRSNGMPSVDPASSWEPRWASNTAGLPAGYCVMQGDGNLVIYDPNNQALWASNTWGHPNSYLAIQDDENVVIYEGDAAIWSTNTWIGGVVHSGFDVATRGFAFINNFPDGYWQFGFLRFATAGLCGGMSFTALDYYWAGQPVPSRTDVPSATSDPLGQYINARQQQSVESNLGGWAVQVLNPDDHALHYWATHDEWNKIKASIDAGNPVPLGLGIYLNGGASHQVIAVGYREGAQERWILTCDPNLPRREGFLHLPPGALHWRDQAGGDWRGYFVSAYSPGSPP
jgi:hypothetical protein